MTNTQTGQEMTDEVADNYLDTFNALTDLNIALTEIQERDYHRSVSDFDRREVAAALRMTEDDPARIARALSYWDDLDQREIDSPNDIGREYVESSLEVIVLFRMSLGNQDAPEVSGAEVLLGFGGPNVRLTWHGNDGMSLYVNWGGDKATRLVFCSPISDYLESITENASEWAGR